MRTTHINEDHLNISFDCEKCGKSFTDLGKLRQHLQKVHFKENRKKQCDICLKWLADAERLAIHKRKLHTGEKPYACNFCQESFCSSLDNNVHKRTKHPDSHNADQKRKEWLQENPMRDPLEYRMKCHLCVEVVSTIGDLRNHWEKAHPGETDNPVRPFYNSFNPIMCELCGVELQNGKHLKIHTFEYHESEATKCPICMIEYTSRDEAISHIKGEHSWKPPSMQKNAICEECGLTGTPAAVRERVHMTSAIFRVFCLLPLLISTKSRDLPFLSQKLANP